jgi:quinol monooxygenase YgiN
MKKYSFLFIFFLACSLIGYGQEVTETNEQFSKENIAQAEISIDRIIEKIETSLSDKQKPFVLAIRLKAKPEHLQKVLASYKGQQTLAAGNKGNLLYYIGLDVNDNSIFIYEHWKDFASFIKHERHSVTLHHFARTADWLEKERNLQIVTNAF